MICRTLKSGEQILQHEAVLHAAQAVPQAADVPGLDFPNQSVNDLLLGLHLPGQLPVKAAVSFHCALQNVREGTLHHFQLALGLIGEADLLLPDLLGRLGNGNGVVRDPLHIGYGVKQGIENPVVCHGKAHIGQLHQVGAQSILIAVGVVFQSLHLRHNACIVFPGQAHCQGHSLVGILCHPDGNLVGALNGDGGGTQQTLVQQLRLFLLLVIRHGQGCQLHQKGVHGKQNRRCRHVEGGVNHGNVHFAAGFRQECPGVEQANTVEQHHKNQGAHDVEVQMHHGGAAGIFVGTDGAHHGGNAGADVLAQNHRDGAAEGHRAGGAQALQNTHRGRGGLDDRRQRRAYQNADKGIGEGHHQLRKPRLVLQELH